MDRSIEGPWVYIGECPVCVNGIARVRTCTGGEGVHFFAVCDECEAMWTGPDTGTEKQFADAVDPRCPICSAALYGHQSHWTMPQELDDSVWSAMAILAWPSAQPGLDEETELEEDDVESPQSQLSQAQPSQEFIDPDDRTTGC